MRQELKNVRYRENIIEYNRQSREGMKNERAAMTRNEMEKGGIEGGGKK